MIIIIIIFPPAPAARPQVLRLLGGAVLPWDIKALLYIYIYIYI